MRAVVLDALGEIRPGAAPSAVTPSFQTAQALRAHDVHAAARRLGDLPDHAAAVLVLADDELTTAGDHAEGLIAEAARALRPGGLLLASARNPLRLPPGGGLRGFRAEELRQAVEHRGFVVELLAAPGAAARVAAGAGGDGPDPAYDRLRDCGPGLLDAGERVVVVARSPLSEAQRSAVFLRTVPRKIVAAAVVCRDHDDRLLVVHDDFRDHWTIPGGVVDGGEDPLTGAVREAWEESGVPVRPGALLGVFAAPIPDRLLLVYAATPAAPAPDPRPVQTHEVSEARWLPLDAALALLNPATRLQVRRCLAEPGGTWPGL